MSRDEFIKEIQGSSSWEHRTVLLAWLKHATVLLAWPPPPPSSFLEGESVWVLFFPVTPLTAEMAARYWL